MLRLQFGELRDGIALATGFIMQSATTPARLQGRGPVPLLVGAALLVAFAGSATSGTPETRDRVPWVVHAIGTAVVPWSAARSLLMERVLVATENAPAAWRARRLYVDSRAKRPATTVGDFATDILAARAVAKQDSWPGPAGARAEMAGFFDADWRPPVPTMNPADWSPNDDAQVTVDWSSNAVYVSWRVGGGNRGSRVYSCTVTSYGHSVAAYRTVFDHGTKWGEAVGIWLEPPQVWQ